MHIRATARMCTYPLGRCRITRPFKGRPRMGRGRNLISEQRNNALGPHFLFNLSRVYETAELRPCTERRKDPRVRKACMPHEGMSCSHEPFIKGHHGVTSGGDFRSSSLGSRPNSPSLRAESQSLHPQSTAFPAANCYPKVKYGQENNGRPLFTNACASRETVSARHHSKPTNTRKYIANSITGKGSQ
jgi:hypothetical protein